MSDTPRTDALLSGLRNGHAKDARPDSDTTWNTDDVMAFLAHSRTLERELNSSHLKHIESLGITLLDAKWLDPECFKGCQSLRWKHGILNIAIECNCRAEHGAEGREHLLYVENKLKELLK